MLIKHHEYFTYIVTNVNKTVLYVGVTNELPERVAEHYFNQGKRETFAGRYNCFNLVYFKSFKYVNDAIDFETRIKGWSRKKKEALIADENPEWQFLNTNIMEWPPQEELLDGRKAKYKH